MLICYYRVISEGYRTRDINKTLWASHLYQPMEVHLSQCVLAFLCACECLCIEISYLLRRDRAQWHVSPCSLIVSGSSKECTVACGGFPHPRNIGTLKMETVFFSETLLMIYEITLKDRNIHSHDVRSSFLAGIVQSSGVMDVLGMEGESKGNQ